MFASSIGPNTLVTPLSFTLTHDILRSKTASVGPLSQPFASAQIQNVAISRLHRWDRMWSRQYMANKMVQTRRLRMRWRDGVCGVQIERGMT